MGHKMFTGLSTCEEKRRKQAREVEKVELQSRSKEDSAKPAGSSEMNIAHQSCQSQAGVSGLLSSCLS